MWRTKHSPCGLWLVSPPHLIISTVLWMVTVKGPLGPAETAMMQESDICLLMLLQAQNQEQSFHNVFLSHRLSFCLVILNNNNWLPPSVSELPCSSGKKSLLIARLSAKISTPGEENWFSFVHSENLASGDIHAGGIGKYKKDLLQ